MKLQKSPLALLGAFALKHLGQNPPEFGETVTPSVDVYDQYLAEQMKTMSGLTALTIGPGTFTATYTVPNGKAWRMIASGGFVTVNAADAAIVAQGSVTIAPPASGAVQPILHVDHLPAAGSAPRAFGWTERPPIFVPPGWSINVVVGLSAAITNVTGAFIGSALLVQELDL